MERGTTTGWEVIPPLPPSAGVPGAGDGAVVPGGAAAGGGAGAGAAGAGAGGGGAGSAVADVPAPVVPGAGVRGWGVRGGRVWAWAGWPLVVVLVVQAVLSLRLVGADTAFQDEAAYLWAGHLEWADWLHGGGVPPFQAYFSVEEVPGIEAARILDVRPGTLWRRLHDARRALRASIEGDPS